MDKNNYLLFKGELQGKMKRTRIKMYLEISGILTNQYESIRKYGKIRFMDEEVEVEAVVVDILEIDLCKKIVRLEIDYYENDWIPKSERRKLLYIVK